MARKTLKRGLWVKVKWPDAPQSWAIVSSKPLRDDGGFFMVFCPDIPDDGDDCGERGVYRTDIIEFGDMVKIPD